MADIKTIPQAMFTKLTDPENVIATAEGLSQGRCAGARIYEIKLRLRLVRTLQAQGIHVPDATRVIAWLKTQLRKVGLAERRKISEDLATVTASSGVILVDEKGARKRREKLERERRKANGDCVECPQDNVRRAAHGSTMCIKCEGAHKVRNKRYRRRQKKHKAAQRRGPVDTGNASGADNEVRATTEKMTDGANASTQSGSAKPTVDATAGAHQVEPQRSNTGGGLPFLTRRKQ